MAVEKTRVPLLRDEGTTITQHGELRARPAGGGGVPVLTSLVAGAAAGAVAKTAIAPLDRCKINFQVSSTPYSWAAALRFLRDAVRAEGWAALWRGNSATMARIVPYAAVQFAAHEQWKRVLGVDGAGAQAAPLRLLLAGSLAGVTSQSATYPLDVARARMAVAERAPGSLRSVLARVLRREGALSLYRGYSATVLGVIPYAGVSFFTYDTLKQAYRERAGREPGGPAKLAMGGAAGALAQTASYPLDIVRRRMQTAPRRADRTYPYPTVAAALRQVWRSEGWRGFFKGLSMNWVKGPIAVGISFTTYDFIKSSLAGLTLPLS